MAFDGFDDDEAGGSSSSGSRRPWWPMTTFVKSFGLVSSVKGYVLDLLTCRLDRDQFGSIVHRYITAGRDGFVKVGIRVKLCCFVILQTITVKDMISLQHGCHHLRGVASKSHPPQSNWCNDLRIGVLLKISPYQSWPRLATQRVGFQPAVGCKSWISGHFLCGMRCRHNFECELC